MTRRQITKIAAIVAASVAAMAAAAVQAQDRPLVAAHRGGALLMPENTFPAFDNAVRLGADQLEFDVEMTKDDQLVITHDGVVNASFCTPDPGSGVAAGPVRALTLSQIETFDCGSKHRDIYSAAKAVPGTRMPTFEAFLARYKSAPVEFYGETKMPEAGAGTVDPVKFARMMEAAIRKFGLEDRFILQSKDWRTVDAMHEINPRIRTCLYDLRQTTMRHVELARQHHATCLLVPTRDGDAAHVKALRDAGITVYSDVVNDEQGWRDSVERGVDVMITDDPAGAIAFLKARAAGK